MFRFLYAHIYTSGQKCSSLFWWYFRGQHFLNYFLGVKTVNYTTLWSIVVYLFSDGKNIELKLKCTFLKKLLKFLVFFFFNCVVLSWLLNSLEHRKNEQKKNNKVIFILIKNVSSHLKICKSKLYFTTV